MRGEGSPADFLGGEPEHPASYYVHDGPMLAQNYLQDVLTADEYRLVQKVADRIAEVLARPIHSPGTAEFVDVSLLENPWVSFAVEVRLLERSSERANAALARYRELEPFLSQLELDEKPLRYVAEARRTYLLGLDAACVAFCGAALEQVLKEVLRLFRRAGRAWRR